MPSGSTGLCRKAVVHMMLIRKYSTVSCLGVKMISPLHKDWRLLLSLVRINRQIFRWIRDPFGHVLGWWAWIRIWSRNGSVWSEFCRIAYLAAICILQLREIFLPAPPLARSLLSYSMGHDPVLGIENDSKDANPSFLLLGRQQYVPWGIGLQHNNSICWSILLSYCTHELA